MGAVPEAGTDAAARAGGRRWSFGTAVFDERSYELRVNGQPVELERKSLEVLRQLLYRAGEVVTKDELLELVWHGRIVSESVPAKCISRIREAIGDDAQAIIKTVHGYGYRLVASLKVETSRAAPALTRLDLKAGDHPPLRPLWSLVRQLGAGGQGEIWLVRHDKIGEERVYKFALDVAGLAAIKREITLSRFLRETLEGRDEFIRVLDWNLEEAPYYVELEHASGNLESWAEAQGGLACVPLTVRLEIIAKVADALAAAHSVGVLHKDLKPSNVLIAAGSDGAPKVKLADFGSGGVLDPKRLEALGITRLGFTQSIMQGEAAATAMYLAPEVMSGQPATVQADVYALGILLYQMVIGDLKRPLAPGWERLVDDPLLSEDIALAVAGEPTRRLADASGIATRLRKLEERRRQREAEQAEKLRLEQEQKATEERARKAELAVERLHTRRAWQRTVLAILIVAVSISLGLFLQARQARNEAAEAAASSQAVADFLSKDLFATAASRPLRDLSVRELLEGAGTNISDRVKGQPAAAAQLHASLGNALFSTDSFAEAEKHLDQALDYYAAQDSGSPEAVAVAARLVAVKIVFGKLPAALPRYDAIATAGSEQLGSLHSAVLKLRQELAQARFAMGRWREAADAFRTIAADARASPDLDSAVFSGAEQMLAVSLWRVGNYASAEKILRESLMRMTEGNLGSSLAAGSAHTMLGAVLTDRRQFAEAEAELKLAARIIRPWVPDETSVHLLSVRNYVGILRIHEGHADEAIAVLEDVLRTAESLDPKRRSAEIAPEPAIWLARAYCARGRMDEALATLEAAVTGSQRTLGPSHPLTQAGRIYLADVLRLLHQVERARTVLSSVDATSLVQLQTDHPINADFRRIQKLLSNAA